MFFLGLPRPACLCDNNCDNNCDDYERGFVDVPVETIDWTRGRVFPTLVGPFKPNDVWLFATLLYDPGDVNGGGYLDLVLEISGFE